MTLPNDPMSQPHDGATAPRAAAGEGYQPPQQWSAPTQPEQPHPGYGPGYEPEAPATYDPADQPAYAAVPPPAGNGLGIAALILSILFWPVGLVLGIVAVVKNRGKGLGIAAIIISTLALFSTVLLIVFALSVDDALNGTGTNASAPKPAATSDTSATPPAVGGIDPACAGTEQVLLNSQSEIQSSSNDPKALAAALDKVVGQLNEQKAKATAPAVTDSLGKLVDDYTELKDDLVKSKVPADDLLQRLTADVTSLQIACS